MFILQEVKYSKDHDSMTIKVIGHPVSTKIEVQALCDKWNKQERADKEARDIRCFKYAKALSDKS